MENKEDGQSVRLCRRRGGLQLSSLMGKPHGTLADRRSDRRAGPTHRRRSNRRQDQCRKLPTMQRGNAAHFVRIAKIGRKTVIDRKGYWTL